MAEDDPKDEPHDDEGEKLAFVGSPELFVAGPIISTEGTLREALFGDDFVPLSTFIVYGPAEEIPLHKHRRLYWLMLQPWFPWRLRTWIERRILSRLPTRLRTETIRHHPPQT